MNCVQEQLKSIRRDWFNFPLSTYAIASISVHNIPFRLEILINCHSIYLHSIEGTLGLRVEQCTGVVIGGFLKRGQASASKIPIFAFHTMNLCLKKFRWNAYLQSSNPERPTENLMPSECYLFIPFLRTKSQMGQTKIRSSEKSHNKDHRTNIIATNFVWGQLKSQSSKAPKSLLETLLKRYSYNSLSVIPNGWYKWGTCLRL